MPYDPKENQKENYKLQNKVDQFWSCFDNAIRINKRGLDGKQRILSIIADDFGRQEIKEKLKVGLKEILSNFLLTKFFLKFQDLIYAAKKYNHINGSRCLAKVKPVVT